MYEFYCPVCNRKCENDEIEIRESGWFGDEWIEFHNVCNSEDDKSLKI